MRLDVDGGDAIEVGEVGRAHRLDLDVEQVLHPDVLGPGDVLHGADDRRRLVAPQQGAQRQAAGHGVRIRIVVQQDQDAIRVFEVALVLLDAGAGEGAAEGDGEGGADELGEREIGDVGELRP